MDGVEFFGMLFGCEQFEYLIGELFLATTARLAGDMFDPVSVEMNHVPGAAGLFSLQYSYSFLIYAWYH